MSSDMEKHHALLSALRASAGNDDGSFEQAVASAFEHVFEHLDRLSAHVAPGGPDGEDRRLTQGESATLR